MSTRSGRIRTSFIESSPPKTRKGASPSRSPARKRKSSPPRLSPPPARKSPARKSPSRKPASKFPARKSPSRTTTTKETAEATPKSPAKRPSIKSDEAVKPKDLSAKLDIFRGTRSKRFEYSIKDITLTQSEFAIEKVNGIETISNEIYGLRNRKSVEEFAPRRSSRLREFIDNVPDITRSISKSLSHSKSISKSFDTFSDDENSADELHKAKTKLVTRKLSTPLRNSISNITQIVSRWEFGGRAGSAALMLLIPLTVVSILISCSKSCSLDSLLNVHAYSTLNVWFSIQTSAFVLVQIMIQAVFALIPIFGTKSDRMDKTDTNYCFNACFASIFTVNFLFILDFCQVINKDALLDEYLRLAVITYIFAVILSIVMYMKSLHLDINDLNPYGNTGYVLYDFFMGREIHPHIKRLDVKIWISRICNINALILSILIFTKGVHLQFDGNEKFTFANYKELLNKVQLMPTIIIFSMMQITYTLNFIMREYKITATFYWQSEGIGYLQIVSSALYPFYYTTISKYVADTHLALSANILISASVLYVLGLFVMLVSNNIKYEFRRNPLHPSLANLDSMPTFHGKKLLVSTIWGVLRHPNYTGDILMHIALALPGIMTLQFTAAAPALLTIVVLLHRSWRDHARCKRRYGAAWQRYCKRVPSVIIPKVL